MTIEGGWQVTQYIDAIDSLDVELEEFGLLDGEFGDRDVLFIPETTNRTTGSVDFNGPYLSLNWKV